MPQEPGEFHSHTGWMFKRLDDGTVRMRNAQLDNGDEIAVEFDEGTWCSIVSFVSARGEDHATFNEALDFHNGRV
jgi:hypothetical protein